MKIGIIQLCSELDPQENLGKISKFLKDATIQGVEAVFLPELFYSMSDGTKSTPYLIKEGNEHYREIQALSSRFGVFILGGSAATELNGKVVNRAYNFGPQGDDLGSYDKIHLFSCDIKDRAVINESDIYTPGSAGKIIEAGQMRLGLSICFDIRYPQMYRQYALAGVNILSIAAAFTVPTGKVHWHTLVRARAIENQCFVVAAAQWGKHNARIETFGHSLIVDPWGEILADGTEGEKLIVAELDWERIEAVRKMVKVF